MAITIVATAGASTANSFVTQAEQIAYMAARLNSDTWTTKTGSTLTETEKAALVEATRDLNVKGWLGERVDDVQALAWPRQNVINPDDPSLSYYATTAIPQRVKNACMELAFQYINAGTTDLASLTSQEQTAIKRERVDVLETEYFEYNRPMGLEKYPRVWDEISPLLVSSSGFTMHLVKG